MICDGAQPPAPKEKRREISLVGVEIRFISADESLLHHDSLLRASPHDIFTSVVVVAAVRSSVSLLCRCLSSPLTR